MVQMDVSPSESWTKMAACRRNKTHNGPGITIITSETPATYS